MFDKLIGAEVKLLINPSLFGKGWRERRMRFAIA